jgi:hypothetical protein
MAAKCLPVGESATAVETAFLSVEIIISWHEPAPADDSLSNQILTGCSAFPIRRAKGRLFFRNIGGEDGISPGANLTPGISSALHQAKHLEYTDRREPLQVDSFACWSHGHP